MTKPPTDRQHSRHTSEGSIFNYPSNAATNAASAAATSTTTSILPMTRLDNQPQQQQPQQQYQQPHPNRLIPGNNNNNNSSVNSSPISLTSSTNSTTTTQQQKQQLQNIHLTRISEVAHLSSLPSEFLTHDSLRPLLHIDESTSDNDDGTVNITEYKYYLNPMKSCVIFILLVEMLERFSFYGINYTTTAYLTGE